MSEEKRAKSGTRPNRTLYLSPTQTEWMYRTFGHVQTGIHELINAAMSGRAPKLEPLQIRRPNRRPRRKASKEESNAGIS